VGGVGVVEQRGAEKGAEEKDQPEAKEGENSVPIAVPSLGKGIRTVWEGGNNH
jgi:hypothetical protein